MSSTNKSLLDVATQKLVESQLWRSVFRHGYPDTPLNQSLVMMGNVFLHLHPVKVSRQAMKITYTWCMGGISFFLFLLLTITGVFLMFYYVPDTNTAYQNINQLSSAVSFGHLVRNMHRWAAHLMVVSVTLHMIRVFYQLGGWRAALLCNPIFELHRLSTPMGPDCYLGHHRRYQLGSLCSIARQPCL